MVSDLISVYITKKCNFKCKYCYVYNTINNNHLENDIPINEIKEFIDKKISTIKNKFIRIEFLGGEPLLCIKKIDEICKYLISIYKEKIFKFSLSTNGSIYSNEIINIIKKYDINIIISFDGIRISHNSNRIYKNNKGTYDDIIENIKKFIKDIDPICHCTLNKLNIGYLEENINHFNKLGFNKLEFGFVNIDYEFIKDRYFKIMKKLIENNYFNTYMIDVFNFGEQIDKKTIKTFDNNNQIIFEETVMTKNNNSNKNTELANLYLRTKKNNLTIVLIITEKCNLQCKYCYVNQNLKDSFVITDKTINNLPKFIKNILKYYQTVNIDLFGGEPTLEWDKCLKILKTINDNFQLELLSRITCRILSNNSTPMYDKYLYIKKHYPLTKFNFSYDGSNISSKYSRNMNDEQLNVITKNLKDYINIFNLNINEVSINYVICPDNVKYLYDGIYNLFYKNNFMWFGLNTVKEDVWDDKSINILEIQLSKIANLIIDSFNNNKIFFSNRLFKLPIIGNQICSVQNRTIFGIAPNGDIYPCQRFYNDRMKDYCLGNISSGIIRTDEYFELENFKHGLFEKCKECELYGHCIEQCFCSLYEVNGNFEYINSVCSMSKTVYKIAKKINDELKCNKLYNKIINN